MSKLLQNVEHPPAPKFTLLVFDLCVSFMFCVCLRVVFNMKEWGQNIG